MSRDLLSLVLMPMIFFALKHFAMEDGGSFWSHQQEDSLNWAKRSIPILQQTPESIRSFQDMHIQKKRGKLEDNPN